MIKALEKIVSDELFLEVIKEAAQKIGLPILNWKAAMLLTSIQKTNLGELF